MLELEAHRTSWTSGACAKAHENQAELGSVSLSTCGFAEVCEAGSLPMELTAHVVQESEQPQERQGKAERLEVQQLPGANEMSRERSHNAHDRPGPPAPTFHTHKQEDCCFLSNHHILGKLVPDARFK